MSGAPAQRAASLAGLVIAAAVALWWLGSARLALERGSDPGRSAAEALHALWLGRAVVLAITGPRLAALGGWRAAATAGLFLIAPAWPLMAFAGSASALPIGALFRTEALMLAAAALFPSLGAASARALPGPAADIVAATVGVAVASALWFTRGHWLPGLA